MKYRMIGPHRGGRVTAVTGVPSQPYTFYMGSTGGGVWKTTDAGHSWANISDGYFAVASMGASRGLALESRCRLRRHRLVENPQQCLHRPRHLQIHRRRQDVDLHRACATPAKSPPSASTPPIPTWSTSPRSAIPSSPNTDRGVFRTQRWRQDLEEGPLRFRRRGRGRSRTAARQPQRRLRLHVARPAQALDHHQRRARRRHLQEHRWRRHLEQARRRPAQRSVRPQQRRHLGVQAESHLRAHRGQAGLGPLPLRRRRRDLDAGQRRRRPSSRGRSTTTRSASTPTIPTSSSIGDESWFKSTDGGKTFRTRPAPHGDHHDIWINPEELAIT